MASLSKFQMFSTYFSSIVMGKARIRILPSFFAIPPPRKIKFVEIARPIQLLSGKELHLNLLFCYCKLLCFILFTFHHFELGIKVSWRVSLQGMREDFPDPLVYSVLTLQQMIILILIQFSPFFTRHKGKLSKELEQGRGFRFTKLSI